MNRKSISECNLVILMVDVDNNGYVTSYNRFGIDGVDTARALKNFLPQEIQQGVVSMARADILEFYQEHTDTTSWYDAVSFPRDYKVDAVVTPLEFVEFLVKNPSYIESAESANFHRDNEFEYELTGY